MRKTYLNSDKINNAIDIKNSYLEKHSEESLHFFYEPLPMEYDVFSELDNKNIVFQSSQKEFLDAFF